MAITMTDKERNFLDRINKYAEEVLGDIDPQKTQISVQLEKLKPIMEELSLEEKIPVEDVFIKYMDLASTFSVQNEHTFQVELKENGDNPLF